MNLEEALLPRMRDALRAGVNGCGADVYPKLLPLLANVPEDAPGAAALLRGAPEWLTEGLTSDGGKPAQNDAGAASRLKWATGSSEEMREGVSAFFELALLAMKRLPNKQKEVVTDLVSYYSTLFLKTSRVWRQFCVARPYYPIVRQPEVSVLARKGRKSPVGKTA